MSGIHGAFLFDDVAERDFSGTGAIPSGRRRLADVLLSISAVIHCCVLYLHGSH